VTVIGPVGVGVLLDDVDVLVEDADVLMEEVDVLVEDVDVLIVETDEDETKEELEGALIGTAWYTLSLFDPPQYSYSRISFFTSQRKD
jgi:hypothetical protein